MLAKASLGVAAIAVLAAGSWTHPPAAAAGAAIDIGTADVILADGTMGCDVTLSATNTGSTNIKLLTTSQVRAKPKISPSYGTWKKLWGSEQTVPAGKSWSDVVRLDFGCNYLRQYRFRVKHGTNEVAFTFPSSGGTTITSIGMGNLYTKFFD
ncbi:MAG TPA: hypothetical protein VK922_06235 [Gemmatimonadaceae bacterium]|nr:hypothetical protein [Gemmatimonadaceae bacterium]